MAKKAPKAAEGKPSKVSKKPAGKGAVMPPANPKPQFDGRGTQFDAEQHAVGANNEPHRDSAGNFVRKEHHYQAPKAAGRGAYPDTFRHE